jgi:hypothetical protein
MPGQTASKLDLVVYRIGIVHISVCVPKDTTVEDIERAANREHPTGIKSQWIVSTDKTFADGTSPNPCPCDRHSKERLHYLMEC